MILVTTNRSRQLLYLNYIGVVTADELRECRSEIEAQAVELKPGFTLLVSLSHLAAMDVGCMTEVGRNMELMDRLGVGVVVRVIPDVSKDIGMNTLTLFHYPHQPRVVTCGDMMEAVTAISGISSTAV